MATLRPGLGSFLLDRGLIRPEQLEAALEEQQRTRERLGEILVRRRAIGRAELRDALASQLGLSLFDPARHAVEAAAMEFVPIEFARRHALLPLRIREDCLAVVMSDPLDVEAQDHLRQLLDGSGRALEILVATPDVVSKALEHHYRSVEGSRNVSRLIDRVVGEVAAHAPGEVEDEEEAQRRAQDAGVIKLVDQIVAQALEERATDIHIEPQERELFIRYRVDGLLTDAVSPPRAVFTGVVSRIKILADMDIAERRMAQDGRFTHRVDGREVDVRVSAIPTIHGEKLVLRLLDKTNFDFSLRELGFSEEDYRDFREAIHNPYGMILLSGPTGSGKTTTLYASLLELRDETLNITTIEDPVEYQIGRINQVQVNARKQMTFAQSLRSFLRQDPDVIMVGEIRDRETAEIAVRAALTGHMVFSTIHANDAPATATRLLSMGVEPFMAASALTMVAAQRLVRRTCQHCTEEYRPTDEVLLALESDLRDLGPVRFQRGTGCEVCRGRGYHGRIAIVEKMVLSRGLRQLIAAQEPATAIRELALSEGMTTLRRGGLEKAAAGLTTVEEVLRVCLADD